MKKHLLIGASILAFGITTTAIYAQVTGTSVIDKMKAVAHSFTLATSLNPGDSSLTSDPVKGKKTGDMLTAGEWNRVLELVSDGGGGAGWVDVSLSDNADFDASCEYRFKLNTWGVYANIYGENPFFYASSVDPVAISYTVVSSSGEVSHIMKTSKTVFRLNGTSIYPVTKIEKLCGGAGATSSPSCPSGFVAIGSYCIEPTMSSTGKTWYEAAVACTDKGAQLCHWSEWSAACLKGKLTDVVFGASGKYEWIDDYSIGNQGIADPIVHSDCKYLSRQADTTAAANTGYRCCTSQK